MSGEAQTLYEVYEAIEETLSTYGERSLKQMIRKPGLTTEEVHVFRGKVQAVEDLLTNLRNTLGYDPETLATP